MKLNFGLRICSEFINVLILFLVQKFSGELLLSPLDKLFNNHSYIFLSAAGLCNLVLITQLKNWE